MFRIIVISALLYTAYIEYTDSTKIPCTLVEYSWRSCTKTLDDKIFIATQQFKSSLGTDVIVECGKVNSCDSGPCNRIDIGMKGYCQQEKISNIFYTMWDVTIFYSMIFALIMYVIVSLNI